MAVDRLFTAGVGQEGDDIRPELSDPRQTWRTVSALQTGYIQEIDTAELLAFAGEHKTVVRMERGIGESLIEGTPVLSVSATGR